MGQFNSWQVCDNHVPVMCTQRSHVMQTTCSGLPQKVLHSTSYTLQADMHLLTTYCWGVCTVDMLAAVCSVMSTRADISPSQWWDAVRECDRCGGGKYLYRVRGDRGSDLRAIYQLYRMRNIPLPLVQWGLGSQCLWRHQMGWHFFLSYSTEGGGKGELDQDSPGSLIPCICHSAVSDKAGDSWRAWWELLL